MKTLHLSSFDMTGGAARSAHRIHQGLQGQGVDSRMLVQFKSGHNRAVESVEQKLLARLRSSLDSSLLKLYNHQELLFSLQWFPDAIGKRIAAIDPDIVHLNWVCNGFLRLETLPHLNQPLVWTLQDMCPFTGGCHYSLGCDRYQFSCGACPQLKSQRDGDLSRWVWQRKARAWKDLNLTIVAPSSWMATCARKSSLFRDLPIEIIPFGLDTTRFRPLDRAVARELLGLPPEKKLILFGAISGTDDPRKGFPFLQAALKQLSQTDWGDRIELVVFGGNESDEPVDLGFRVHCLGHLNDDLALRVAYAAADVMVVPSIEEAFGQVATEAFACGTPVVVFDQTGLADIVDHQVNGYVARQGAVDDLARGMTWVLEDTDRHQQLGIAAREKAEREFRLEIQADRYLKLFHQILKSRD